VPDNSGRRWILAATVLLAAASGLPAASLKERLTEAYLSGLRREGTALRELARPAPRSGELLDVRCLLHVHSNLSHDSPGTAEEIIRAAKAVGARAVFMAEHPTPDRKWITVGLSGERDGVLFVPGAEMMNGLLLWRTEAADWTPRMSAEEVLEKVKDTPGLAFVAHPEKRKEDADWELPPFAGMEIYNSHADAEDSSYEEFLQTFRTGGPLKVLSLLATLKKYPQESYAAIFDEQAPVLKRWDALNVRSLPGGRRVVGIAGNDSHQNVGIAMVASEEGVEIRDGLGKAVGNIPKKNLPLLLLGGLEPGSTLLSHTFDPYEVSFRYVSTHLLAPEVTEAALMEALRRGRAYVAFDWMGDPSGFRYAAESGGKTVEMGGEVRAADRPRLKARTGMPCRLRLLRNGEEVRRVEGAELEYEATEPGVYRVEAWVRLGEEERPWIYTNPVYVLP
jgi:hypothetical protein